MRLSEARGRVAAELRASGVESSEVEADLLVEHVIGRERSYFIGLPALHIGEEDLQRLLALASRRCSGEPLQYILGSWEFYGYPVEVAEGVLIPRFDTEAVVEKTLSLLPPGGRFIDWGTGSGCITLAILLERPDVRALAVDSNPRAVALAWRNLNRAGLLPRCLLWHSREPEDIPGEDGGFSVIVSNPPYIPSAQIASLPEEVKREPVSALDGGPDGLKWYKALFDWGGAKLGLGGWLVLEFGHSEQGGQLQAIAPSIYEFKGIFNDLSGKPRGACWIRV